jgi:hypothetical protein
MCVYLHATNLMRSFGSRRNFDTPSLEYMANHQALVLRISPLYLSYPLLIIFLTGLFQNCANSSDPYVMNPSFKQEEVQGRGTACKLISPISLENKHQAEANACLKITKNEKN